MAKMAMPLQTEPVPFPLSLEKRGGAGGGKGEAAPRAYGREVHQDAKERKVKVVSSLCDFCVLCAFAWTRFFLAGFFHTFLRRGPHDAASDGAKVKRWLLSRRPRGRIPIVQLSS
jgi:hypothetical protein